MCGVETKCKFLNSLKINLYLHLYCKWAQKEEKYKCIFFMCLYTQYIKIISIILQLYIYMCTHMNVVYIFKENIGNASVNFLALFLILNKWILIHMILFYRCGYNFIAVF